MITKRDWKKFVRRLSVIHDASYKNGGKLTIRGHEVVSVNLVKDEVNCVSRDYNDVQFIVYRHPDSFDNGKRLSYVKDTVRFELDVYGIDAIYEAIRTR